MSIKSIEFSQGRTRQGAIKKVWQILKNLVGQAWLAKFSKRWAMPTCAGQIPNHAALGVKKTIPYTIRATLNASPFSLQPSPQRLPSMTLRGTQPCHSY